MVNVEPVVAPLVAQIAFGLGDFIGMMGEGVVDAACVDIQLLTQVLHGNAGALDMPAGIPHAPGRVPFQGLVFEFGFGEPENKVVFVLFIQVLFHALPDTHGQVFFVVVVENVILIQSGSVKVDVAPCNVGASFIQQGLYHVNVFINAVGGRLHHIRALNVQLVAVGEKGVGVALRNFHNGLMLPAGAFEHFVFAGIRVRGQVAHVGDIHDPLHRISQIPQGFFQHVLHNVGTEVANVGIVVHRGSAGVHFHQIGIVGDKELFFVGQGIVQIHSLTS